MQIKHSQAIGLFDSGIGGITVMQQIRQALPHENLIYFGDTARIPYGGKSRETVTQYALEIAHFLTKRDIKLLIVACNTASAFAIEVLRQALSIPIIGVIEPGAKKAISVTRNQRIAVLGTKGTIQSEAYQKAIKQSLPQAIVLSIACPLFVPLVEERFLHHPATQMIIKEYLYPLRGQQVDTLLLGCTHYPLLKHFIQQEMGSHVCLVDSASTCADEVSKILYEQNLSSSSLSVGSTHYYVSDDPEKFSETVEQLFQQPIQNIEKITL